MTKLVTTKIQHIQFDIKLPPSDKIDKLIEEQQLDVMSYDKRYRNYRIRVTSDEVEKKKYILTDLFEKQEKTLIK